LDALRRYSEVPDVHFYTLKALWRGYAKHIEIGGPGAEFAGASLGESFEATRFYYADAAMLGVIANAKLTKTTYGDSAGLAARTMMSLIRYTVEAFLDERQQREAAKAGKQPMDFSRGARRARARTATSARGRRP
jgi:hypothetical protein